MGQANKVISAFILLGVAIFVLWLMLTKTQSLRSFFLGRVPLTQMFSGTRPSTTPSASTTPLATNQSEFAAKAKDAFNNVSAQSDGNTKVNVIGESQKTTPTQTPPPKATSYPKTGAEAAIIPVATLVFFVGKRIVKYRGAN